MPEIIPVIVEHLKAAGSDREGVLATEWWRRRESNLKQI
jgi:hypothetical protein